MVGNDIINLKQAAIDSDWQRPGYLDKIFTKKEQAYIQTSANKNETVWLLWSMKEAAYKINVQQHKVPFYNPKKLTCQLVYAVEGIVSVENTSYQTKSILNQDFIYTTATATNFENMYSHFSFIKSTSAKVQSVNCRKELLKAFSKAKNISLKNLQILKSEAGIPKIFQNSIELKHSISLTHHGNYCGYSFSLT